MRRRDTARLIAIVALLAVLVLPAAAHAQTITWGQPQPVIHQAPFSSLGAVMGIACPSSTFCVGANDYGAISVASAPTAGVWTVAHARRTVHFKDISCPTPSFCAAVTTDGAIVASDAPASDSSWKLVYNAFTDMNAVSCASATLCVAAGNGRFLDSPGVLVATDPLKAPWKLVTWEIGIPLTDVSCVVATTICVAVDGNGGFMDTTGDRPPTTTLGWRPSQRSPDAPTTISCPRPGLCIGVERTGDVVYRVGNDMSRLARGLPAGKYKIDCASESLCVDIASGSTTSRVFTGNRQSWVPSASHTAPFTAVGCTPGGTACALGTLDGKVVATANAAVAAPVWSTSAGIDQMNTLVDVDCVSPTACITVDNSGHFATSANPAGGAGTWTTMTVPGTPAMAYIDCPSMGLCVVTADNGEIVTVEDPFGTPVATVRKVSGTDGGSSIACPTASLCVFLTWGGKIVTSSAPNSPAWTATQVTAAGFTAVTCPSANMCLGTTFDGHVWGSADPAGGAATWVDFGHAHSLQLTPTAITCQSERLCLAGDAGGNVWELDPWFNPAAWSESFLELPAAFVTDIDCSADPVCVAVSDSGVVATGTREPYAGVAWTTKQLAPTSIYGVACAGTAFCITTDVTGATTTGAINHVALTVAMTGPGTGTVTSDPSSFVCSATCVKTVPVGAEFALDAAPAAGSVIHAMSGADFCHNDPRCFVRLLTDRTVTVEIRKVQRALTVAREGNGTVTSQPAGIACGQTCSASFDDGQQVSLEATPADGQRFTGWSGACAGTMSPCQLPMNAAKTVTAQFAAVEAGTPVDPTPTDPTPKDPTPKDPTPNDPTPQGGAPGAAPGPGGSPTPTANPGVLKKCVVPNLRGKTLAAAKKALAKANCKLGTVKQSKRLRGKKTKVGAQTKKPRASLTAGTKIGVRLVAAR